MKRIVVLFLSILTATAALSATAQVLPSAYTRQISITVGGMGSVFQPAFAYTWSCEATCLNPVPLYFPVAQAGKYPLFGMGAYVDIKYNRWIQFEAEGRWMRLNQYEGISQDNYLVGPRIPIHRFRRAEFYGKALIGDAEMTFEPQGGHVSFTDLAFGGGADIRLSKRWSLRLPDLEYQYYPKWNDSSLNPYGASIGIGYKLF